MCVLPNISKVWTEKKNLIRMSLLLHIIMYAQQKISGKQVLTVMPKNMLIMQKKFSKRGKIKS